MEQSSVFARSAFDDSTGAGPVLPADRLLLRMLDEMEYGMLLVEDDGRLRYSNALGRDELGDGGPLALAGGIVTSSNPRQRAALRHALDDAFRGRRQLLSFPSGAASASIAVTPILDGDDFGGRGTTRYALLVFGKRPDATNLSLDFFARAHGLTGAESAVMALLAHGHDPADIAARQSVAISTIRSQIASVRAKTRTGSIRELLDRVAMLPPIRTVVRAPARRVAEACN